MRTFQSGEPPVKNPGAERRWVWWFAIAVMFLTTLPYWLGYVEQGEAYRFTGFVYAVEDGNSYIAKMLGGTYGAFLFRSPYTFYPQRGVLIFLPYILIGKLAAPPGLHEQLVVLFHLFRIGAGIFSIHATYSFLSFFLQDLFLRRFGLALATLGGGLGWLLVVLGRSDWLGSLPLEFYSPETFGFLGLYGAPHLSMSRAFLLLSLLAYLQAVRGNPRSKVLKITLFWTLAGIMQPLATLVIGFLFLLHLTGLAVWFLIARSKDLPRDWSRWRESVRMVVLASIVPTGLVLYNLVSYAIDPFLRIWTEQNILHSPHPAHYLLAFGLVIPFAILGARRILNRDLWEGWLLVGWVLALPVLAYAPVNLQRRLPEGVWVPLVVLALVAIQAWKLEGVNRSRWKNLLVLIPLLLCFPSTLFLLAGGMFSTRGKAEPIFRPVDEVAAFQFLRDNAAEGSVVLASYETGNVLPAWAPLRVVIGLGPESANLAELRQEVTGFYRAATPDDSRLEMICNWDISYIFWGPAERSLGDWDPRQARYLDLLEVSGPYQAYRVTENARCSQQ